MPPAVLSSGRFHTYEEGEVDWNPQEEETGNPSPDAAWHSNNLYQRRSRSADRHRTGGGSSIGNMPRRSSPPPLLERAPEHGNAAYYDTGPRPSSSRPNRGQRGPRQHRATTDDLLSHPFWLGHPQGHMHHLGSAPFAYYPGPLPQRSPGWGNEDAYPGEEEEEYMVKRYHDQRHRDFTSSRQEQEDGEFTEARRMLTREEWGDVGHQRERHGRGQSQRRQQENWQPSGNHTWVGGGGNEDWGGGGGGDGDWGGRQEGGGEWGGEGGGGEWGGEGGGGEWGEGEGGNGWGGGGEAADGRGGNGGGEEANGWDGNAGGGGWGNDGGERDEGWLGEGEENKTRIKSYRVLRPRSTERATQSSWGHAKSTPATGPIPVSDVPPTALERSISDGATPTLTGNGMKKLTRLFGVKSGSISIHPFLRPSGLLRPTTFYWDLRRLPNPARSGIKIGEAVAGLNEPATNPPMAQIRLLVPIPTLDGAIWSVNILSPSEHRAAKLPNPAPALPYSFIGSPTSFGQKFTKLDYRHVRSGHLPSYVRVTDVLHGLHTMLFKPVRKGDWRALEKHHQDAAGAAFYMRCYEIESNDGRVWVHTPTHGTEEIDKAVDENLSGGLRRVDVLVGRTRFDGIESTGQVGEWQVRLAKSNDRPLGPPT